MESYEFSTQQRVLNDPSVSTANTLLPTVETDRNVAYRIFIFVGLKCDSADTGKVA